MENSAIQWTDHTFNPWIGCTKVSPGCQLCYAKTQQEDRYGRVKWGAGQPRSRTKTWDQPVRWNKAAGEEMAAWNQHNDLHGGLPHYDRPERPRVFCASLADWLDEEVPVEWLIDLLRLIHETPNLDWLLLTKRPQNFESRLTPYLKLPSGHPIEWDFEEWLTNWVGGAAPANVWVGTTVEDQTRAEERVPQLLNIPAKVRFLSCEPLLGSLDLEYPQNLFPDGPRRCCDGHDCGCMGKPVDPPLIWGINWVICGGESGPGARPFDLAWARSMRDQCKGNYIPFFMKQLGSNPVDVVSTSKKGGELSDFPVDLQVRQFPEVAR